MPRHSAFFTIPVDPVKLPPPPHENGTSLLLAAALLGTAITSKAQVNSGSDGHDGAFNPTQNVEIDMADHPDGIYHYTSVNIPSGVTVTFKPNAANTPVMWLVEGDCNINGLVSLNGKSGPSGGKVDLVVTEAAEWEAAGHCPV